MQTSINFNCLFTSWHCFFFFAIQVTFCLSGSGYLIMNYNLCGRLSQHTRAQGKRLIKLQKHKTKANTQQKDCLKPQQNQSRKYKDK